MKDSATNSQTIRYRLFDAYGLPWTSTLSGYWVYIITVVTGFAFAFLLGIYLGLWLRSKGKGSAVLLIYLAITASTLLLFFLPDRAHRAEDVIWGVNALLWFTAAYLSRHKVIRYYSDREGTPFKINPVLAGLLSVWYINSCLRSDFPLDETGKSPAGVLKITV